MKPKVSIIIPCLNVEHYLTDALESCINQTYTDLEVIVVDNGSSDKTMAIATAYQEKYPALIKLTQESIPGPSAARNKGLSISSGIWIEFLDADNILQNIKIAHQIELVTKFPKASLIVGSFIHVYVNGKKNQYHPNVDPLKGILTSSLGHTSSNLWRREALDQVGDWNIEMQFGEEYQLMLDLILAESELVYDNMPLTTVRRRPSGQLSLTNWERLSKIKLTLQLKWIETLKEKRPDWYSQNLDFCNGVLYFSILAIGTKDPQAAFSRYEKLFPKINFLNIYHNKQMSPVQKLTIFFLGTFGYIKSVKALKDFIKKSFPGLYSYYHKATW